MWAFVGWAFITVAGIAHRTPEELIPIRQDDTSSSERRTGLPEIRGTRSAQKVVASRGKGRLSREESCYYSEPEGAGVLRGHRRYLEVTEGRRLGELEGSEDLALAGRGQ